MTKKTLSAKFLIKKSGKILSVFLFLCLQIAFLTSISFGAFAQEKPNEGMQATPGMCAMMPNMPGCEKKPTALPGLPGKCIPPGTMGVNPDMCQTMEYRMCGCEKFPQDPKIKPNRRRLNSNTKKEFPQVAPGIEQFSQLGYCTGMSDGNTYTASSNGQTTVEGGVRRYTLRLKQMVEPKTQRTFLRTIMDDQYDENDHIKHCEPLSQMESGVSAKQRPINAPPLFFIEGETAEITVYNDSEIATNNATSIHWHGIILPNDQDGIVNITQAPIPPGGKKVYRFKLVHNGTYWYHPHDLNEQDTRGPFIILPNPEKENKTKMEFGGINVRYHHDRVILLSDYKERQTNKILNYLRDEDRNTYETDSRIHKGWLSQMQCAKEYLENFKMMKMFWMDRADVWYDSFFMNDETCLNCGSKTSKIEDLHTEYPGQKFARLNEFSNIRPGERVRLRIINGSASSYFFLDYANNSKLAPNQKMDMLVVAKDGLPVKPIYIDQLYMGMGETYDVVVDVPDDGTLYELRAKSIDDVPNQRVVRTLIGNNPVTETETSTVVSGRNVPVQICGPYPDEKDQISQINYDELQAPNSRVNANPSDLRPFEVYHSEKSIAQYSLKLSGSMEEYHWMITGTNGTKLQTDDMHMLYMTIKEDYRIRVTIENAMVMGMMNHPWHLHGNWFRLIKEGESDADIAKKALLHTATIFPGQKVTLEFYADPAYRGSWMFHCHNLYHMANDMMMYLRYDKMTDENMSRMRTSGHGSHHDMSILPGALAGIKNQYIVGGVGAGIGTDGMGPTAQVRYRGTLGDNMGFVDFNMDVAGNFNGPNKNLQINGRLKHCFETNKCVFLDLSLRSPNTGQKETAEYAGGLYKPWNSDLVVIESGLGAVCTQDLNSKAINCAPGIKNGVSSTIDVGWNTKVTGKVACEGKLCKEWFVSVQASVTPNPRITIIPVHCKVSTNRDETACMAEIKIVTDPMPFGNQH
ncbi:MAG: multicopper oxidase family protein [Bdellovibrio sp.]